MRKNGLNAWLLQAGGENAEDVGIAAAAHGLPLLLVAGQIGLLLRSVRRGSPVAWRSWGRRLTAFRPCLADVCDHP